METFQFDSSCINLCKVYPQIKKSNGKNLSLQKSNGFTTFEQSNILTETVQGGAFISPK